jgi:hypothetical protein
MLEILKKKWAEWLISLALIVIASILANDFAVKRESKKTIQDELNAKADKVYVDARDFALEKKIETGDANILSYIKQHSEETEKTTQLTIDWLKAINTKLNNIEDKMVRK